MKAMVCEMCNSNDMLKQDGMFVCQSCGTKYSVEEAKKLMIEGTVKIDNSDELNNLYKAARNAKDAGNYKSAIKHYEKISQFDPDAWEPLFYVPILRINSIKNYEIESAAVAISSCLYMVFSIIQKTITDQDELFETLKEIVSESYGAALQLAQASQSFFESLTPGKGAVGRAISPEFTEHTNIYIKIEEIMLHCGHGIEDTFDLNIERHRNLIASSWEFMLELESAFHGTNYNHAMTNDDINKYIEKIKKYDPEYNDMDPIPVKNGGGCYVATAVYGSYDCAEVWTLRRFRDDTLASTWYGRAFIKTYYAISPTLVKWFGDTQWFKNMWKPTLDKMVRNLNNKGVENTPYDDKQW